VHLVLVGSDSLAAIRIGRDINGGVGIIVVCSAGPSTLELPLSVTTDGVRALNSTARAFRND
jgi:hypothetical protein